MEATPAFPAPVARQALETEVQRVFEDELFGLDGLDARGKEPLDPLGRHWEKMDCSTVGQVAAMCGGGIHHYLGTKSPFY